MKKLVMLVVLAVAGGVVWIIVSRPPDPEKERREAQKYVNGVARYWLKCAKEDRLADMQAVCDGMAIEQSESVLEEIHDLEARVGEEYNDYLLESMGAPGAYMALLTAEESGLLLRLTILVDKIEDTHWITSVVSE